MKSIGILGGMAPASTLEYYKILFQTAEGKGWGKKYPEIIIFSINFEEFYSLISEGKTDEVISLLAGKIEALENAGADFALLASNTPHRFFSELDQRVSIPLLNIAEATAGEARKKNCHKAALLGTQFTMEGKFYQEYFEKNDMEIVTPRLREREFINDSIFDELVRGSMNEDTKKNILGIVKKLDDREKIDAVILGCTELPLVFNEENLGIPVLNSTKIHASAAFEYAIAD